MNKIKFLSISLITALLAGIVTFSACKKDDDDPAADGKKAAQEECACNDHLKSFKDLEDWDDLTSAQEAAFETAYDKWEECLESLEKKYKKYMDEDDDSAFWKAYDAEDGKCAAWNWNLWDIF